MRIGIDISQLAYPDTGVANYLVNLVHYIIEQDRENEYVLFYSSMRKRIQNSKLKIQNSNSKVKIKEFKFPPILLNLVWNRFHIIPIEWLIGDIDLFISSDWTQPPTNAKNVTILYDLVIYKYPQETDSKIVTVQKKRLEWVKKECDTIICISEATKKDAVEILKISPEKLTVVYPGI
ncbi:MAG TPA: glycosyltransferase [Candidatus Saccharimonadales bacterium]|nr:glycosyltransferase [Candidatus Saccharimonadales bacterium]